MPLKDDVIKEQSINDNNYKALKKLFPHAVSIDKNGKYVIDPQKLQLSLNPSLADIKEDGYGLNWVGKKEAYHKAFTKNKKVLKPLEEQSKNWNDTGNILIKGDNLDALKILRQNYFEAIKMIYIDPPYNTKNDGFVYNDNFTSNTEQTLEELGYDKEYVDYIENIQGAKTHSGWLSFMYPRLLLAKDLLRDDGVIFISIDDNEVAQLRLLCDEVFGEENFVAQFIHKNNSSKNQAKLVSISTEYFYCYSKNKEVVKQKEWRQIKKGSKDIANLFNKLKKQNFSLEEIEENIKDMYRRPKYSHLNRWNKVDEKGVFKDADLSREGGKKDYTIINPYTNKECIIPNQGWGKSYEELVRLQEEDLIWYGADNTPPGYKDYISEDDTSVPDSFWYYDNSIDTKWIRNEFGKIIFENPKPMDMIKNMIEMIDVQDNDIILDFFAGSGTTAHAVMDLNAKDNGNRKFILVQWAEKTPEKSEAKKAGYESIFDITKERIDRAGKAISPQNNGVDIGFRTFEIVEDSKQKIYQINLNDMTQDDLFSFSETTSIESPNEILYNLLVAESLPLSATIEVLSDKKLYLCENVAFILGSMPITELIEKLKEHKQVEYVSVYSPLVEDDKFSLELESALEQVGVKGDKLRFRG